MPNGVLPSVAVPGHHRQSCRRPDAPWAVCGRLSARCRGSVCWEGGDIRRAAAVTDLWSLQDAKGKHRMDEAFCLGFFSILTPGGGPGCEGRQEFQSGKPEGVRLRLPRPEARVGHFLLILLQGESGWRVRHGAARDRVGDAACCPEPRVLGDTLALTTATWTPLAPARGEPTETPAAASASGEMAGRARSQGRAAVRRGRGDRAGRQAAPTKLWVEPTPAVSTGVRRAGSARPASTVRSVPSR